MFTSIRRTARSLVTAAFVSAGGFAAADAQAQSGVSEFAYSPQLTLSGVTDALQATANYGRGVVFGDLDTGVVNWSGLTGRISPLSTCVIARCTSDLDGNGHGTFTAAQMVGANMNNGVVGEAPQGTLLAVKVLGNNGSGLMTDLATGLNYLAGKANVANMSLSFSMYSGFASAINNFAAHDGVMVFALDNSNAAFNGGQNITGLTDQAIQSIILMGSTSASQQKSSFSNTPGTAGFVSTTGRFYSFASRTLFADGENIWGASNYSTPSTGYAWYTQMSGTSMAAPQGSAASGLLMARWSFLTLQPETVTAILLGTGQDLGAKSIYGEGFINVANAFQPTGTLTEPVGGKMVPVSSLGGTIVASNAVGNLPAVSKSLEDVQAYDAYMRNYTVQISVPIVAATASKATSAATTVQGATGAAARSLVDLGNGQYIALSFTGIQGMPLIPGSDRPNPGLIQDPNHPGINDWSVGFSQRGSYVGVGQGSNAALSFSDARWDGRTAFFNTDADASGALLGVSQKSLGFAAVGLDVGKASRVSMAVTTTSDDMLAGIQAPTASSHGVAVGYTFSPLAGKVWQISLTASELNEQNQLLGTLSNGPLQLGGPSAGTRGMGLGNAFDLGRGYKLGFDMAWAVTDATKNANSMITGTSALTSYALAAAFSKDGVLEEKDTVGITAKKPLRVYSGGASVAYGAGTDMSGAPIVQTQRVSLVPSGNETDLGIAYSKPLLTGMTGSLALSFKNDYGNVAGAKDAAVMTRLRFNF
ncbi:MAG: S8 family peptidase [Stellaceae bacterium]